MRLAASVALLMSALALPASGQQASLSWNGEALKMTRAQLQDMLARYEAAASSRGYSSDLKARAQMEAELIRSRLSDGDFQIGDRIALAVQGQKELSDTFTVTDDRTLLLPQLGSMPLKGVLRSELQSAVTKFIAGFIRDPDVNVRTLIRVTITGDVRSPGFYVVPSEALLSDLLMTAGGPLTGAQLTRMKIERADRVIWKGAALSQAIAQGRTLDQLSLRAGDHIEVPGASGRSVGTTILMFAPLATTLVVLLRQLRVF